MVRHELGKLAGALGIVDFNQEAGDELGRKGWHLLGKAGPGPHL